MDVKQLQDCIERIIGTPVRLEGRRQNKPASLQGSIDILNINPAASSPMSVEIWEQRLTDMLHSTGPLSCSLKEDGRLCIFASNVDSFTVDEVYENLTLAESNICDIVSRIANVKVIEMQPSGDNNMMQILSYYLRLPKDDAMSEAYQKIQSAVQNQDSDFTVSRRDTILIFKRKDDKPFKEAELKTALLEIIRGLDSSDIPPPDGGENVIKFGRPSGDKRKR